MDFEFLQSREFLLSLVATILGSLVLFWALERAAIAFVQICRFVTVRTGSGVSPIGHADRAAAGQPEMSVPNPKQLFSKYANDVAVYSWMYNVSRIASVLLAFALATTILYSQAVTLILSLLLVLIAGIDKTVDISGKLRRSKRAKLAAETMIRKQDGSYANYKEFLELAALLDDEDAKGLKEIEEIVKVAQNIRGKVESPGIEPK